MGGLDPRSPVPSPCSQERVPGLHRQEELLGDSLRALLGLVKQWGLDVCGVREG